MSRSSNGDGERWRAILDSNRALRDHSLAWVLLLYQLTDEKYSSDPRFMSILQFIHQFMVTGLDRTFALEQERFLADPESLPELRPLVRRLREDQEELRACMDKVDKHLTAAAAASHSQTACTSGMEFIGALGTHLQRVKEHFIPFIEARHQSRPGSLERRECT